MKLSPFTPIFFPPKKRIGNESTYIQTFATTDRIMVQIIGTQSEEAPQAELRDLCRGVNLPLVFSKWEMNLVDVVYFLVLSGMANGIYSLTINGMESEPFSVTSDTKDLERTTLMQYSNKDNKQRKDAVFFIDGMQYFFDFRVPGGFKDNAWAFGVENEQFVTDEADIIELYALENTAKSFTLGFGEGVPVWYADLLNRLLTCNYVYLDGERYSRKDQSVPERTDLEEYRNSFVFTQQLQQVRLIDPELEATNQLLLRRIDTDNYREINDNINRKL